MRDALGGLVSSEDRAETMAKYLEQVQWKVRPATVMDDAPVYLPFAVNEQAFSEADLKQGLRKMSSNRAAGPDRIPAEYLKRLSENQIALKILLEFINAC